MYQDGVRVNGHCKKRLHKKKMKERYAKKCAYWYGSPEWNEIVAKYKNQEPTKYGHPLDYWKEFSLSELRKRAKHCSNSKLRSECKKEICCMAKDDEAMENYDAMHGATYQKHFDYRNEIR